MRRNYLLKVSLILMYIVCCHEILLSQTRILLTQPKLENLSVKFAIRIEYDFDMADISDYDLSIKENGVEISPFEYDFECPWKCGNVAIPSNILIDRGISMDRGFPSGIDEARKLSKTFIDIVDKGQIEDDPIRLMSFNDKLTFDDYNYTDYMSLKNKIDSIRTGGQSAIWDAAYLALQSLYPKGESLILITTGNDQSSKHSINDVVDFALANNLRVYSVGIGTDIKDSLLQYVANKTHGKYLSHPDSTMLQKLCYDVREYYFNYGYYCDITYTTVCHPDSRRTIEVTAKGIVRHDSARATVTYISPSTIPQLLDFQVESSTVTGGKTIRVPLLINPNSSKHYFTPNLSALLKSDTNSIKLDSVKLQKIFPQYASIGISKTRGGYYIRFWYDQNIYIADTIAFFYFSTYPRKNDTTIALTFEDWRFMDKCLSASPFSGQLKILKSPTSVKESGIQSKSFYLEQNYPNPFSERTTIQVYSSRRGEFTASSFTNEKLIFKVYDVFGREVLDLSDAIMSNREQRTGNRELTIDNSPSANQLPSPGIYFYRLTIGNDSQTKMMTLLK